MTIKPKMTAYFEEQVLRKRPYLRIEWCLNIVATAVKREVQADGRIRFWGYPPDLFGKALRVITLNDSITLHNAFPDTAFTRRN